MNGVDTNVLVRYILQDDQEQSAIANKFIEKFSMQNKCFISYVVLIELVWVLRGAYGYSKNQIIDVLDNISRADAFEIEKPQIIIQSIRTYEKYNADFADCVIERIAYWKQCKKVYTFDRKASKLSIMQLLE